MLSCPKCCKLQPTVASIKSFLCRGGCLIFFGVALLATGIIAPFYITEYVDEELKKSSLIDGFNSDGYKTFSDNSDFPIVTEFYFMDIKNPLEIMNGEVPVVHERGPFVYHEYKKAFNVSFTENNEKVSWKYYDYFVFQPELSAESEDVEIRSLNMVFQGIRAGSTDSQGKGIMVLMYQKLFPTEEIDRLFSTKTVHEHIFGYEDQILAFANNLNPAIDKRYPGIFVHGNHTSMEYAEQVAERNEMYTGVTDMNLVREQTVYLDQKYLRVCQIPPCPDTNPFVDPWKTKEAGRVHGSDGGQWKPSRVEDKDDLDLWYPPFYRTVDLKFNDWTKFKDIRVAEYQFPDELWHNSQNYPPNADYYQDGYEGLQNVSSFAATAPTYVSKPHFHDCDPELQAGVIGAWPDRNSIHESSIFVEPRSGASFQVSVTSQLNSVISPLPDMEVPDTDGQNFTTWFPNIRTSYVPLFWSRTTVGLSDEDADKFVKGVYGSVFIADTLRYGGCSLGGVMLILGVVWVVMAIRKKRELLKDDTHNILDGSETFEPVQLRESTADLTYLVTDGKNSPIKKSYGSSQDSHYTQME